MSDDAKVEELLVEWELARLDGRFLSAADLAGDSPELLEQVRAGIALLKATSWVVDRLPQPTVTPSDQHAESTDKLPDVDLTVGQFIDELSGTAIIAEDQLATIKHELRLEAGDARARPLAERLVNDGLLTSYQARILLTRGASHLLLDRYVILDVLGSGGMGLVFKALHRSMERIVALKVLPRDAIDSPAKVARFQREIQAAAKLSHPNIVAAHDAHEAGGTHFLVMEYVFGKNLQELVDEQGPLTASHAVSVVAQIAGALSSAHAQNIVHRDVKPSNIILSEEGTPKLLDLGLARVKQLAESEGSSSTLTREGIPMGTAAYIAPEQAIDSRQADARSDIYSLGCTLFFLLTGKPMFDKRSAVQTIAAHMLEEPSSLTDACPGVAAELEQAFAKMVAKQPAQRFASMEQVVGALQETGLLDAQGVAVTAGRQQSPVRFFTVPRQSVLRRRFYVGVAVALAVMLGWVGWLASNGKLATPGPDRVASPHDFAKWVFNTGGTVTAQTAFGEQFFVDAQELPEGDFEIVAIEFYDPETRVDLKPLLQLSQLNRLTLVGFERGNLQLDVIAKLPSVTQLDLQDCALGASDLRVIAAMLALEQLDLTDNDLSDQALRHLAPLQRLEYLYVAGTNVSNDGLHHLTALPRLTHLDLDGTQVTDNGMATLSALPRLTHLDLRNNEITDRGLAAVASLVGITKLWLDYCPITETGLAQLQKLRNLVELSLRGTQVGEDSIAELIKLADLRIVDLSDNDITPKMLDQLGKMPQLRDLRLTAMKLTDELISSLILLQELRSLDVSDTNLDDDGLQRLTALRHLDDLFVEDSKVTEAGLNRFELARPDCTLYVSYDFAEEEVRLLPRGN